VVPITGKTVEPWQERIRN